MKRTKIAAVLSLALITGLTSCQSPQSIIKPVTKFDTKRDPSSLVVSKDWEELRALKQRKIELGALSINFQKKRNTKELKKVTDEKKEVDKKISEIQARVPAFESLGTQVIKNDNVNWRIEKERIEITNLDHYLLDKKVVFSVSTYEAKETRVDLAHWAFSSAGYRPDPMDDSRRPQLDFTIKCDAPFAVERVISDIKVKANKDYKVTILDNKFSSDHQELLFSPDLKSCDVTFINPDDAKKIYGFKIVNEAPKLAALENLMSTTAVCSLKKDSTSFFDTTEFLSMTCPEKYDSIDLLPEPEDSLHARVVSLLGKDLPEDFIKNGNPYAELDFSKAPKYDAILISYLVFRSDFYGTLLSRLLSYHADKGAVVRIIVSEVIALDKDKAMFEKMMTEHPNIKVTRYKFDNKQQGGAWISEFHRTNHVKLFIAYSKDNPNDSSVIMGGKNVHDGFVFKTPVDVSKYPEVVNYVSGDESWAYWRDFEMVVHGQKFVESVVRHYMNFYHINKKNLVMKLSSVAVQKEAALESEEQMMRHYVSIPFKDEPNLNLFYARLIDSSKKKLLISTPYFRPVKEIADALERALKRDVDITIITRLDLEGDTADFILGAVNKDGVNQYFNKIKVFEYIEPNVILHSKLMMIDDEVTFVSSVNLNKRSFYHDLENGVIVNDHKFTADMSELYTRYLTICKQIKEEQKIVFWKRWFIKIFDKVFVKTPQ